MKLIAAVADNGVIGYQGKIPWVIREDLQLFKQYTLDQVVIMGRKTWDSLPKKPLGGRENIVVSQTMTTISFAAVCKTLEEAMILAGEKRKEVFLIGGSQLYKVGLERKMITELYISHVHLEPRGDTFFPIRDFSPYELLEKKEFTQFTFCRYHYT